MKVRLAISAILFAAGLTYFYYVWTVTPQKRIVMWYGTDIKEHYRDFGILPDFTYFLSAKIDPSDFHAISKQLGLESQTLDNPIEETNIRWGNCPEAWWPKDLSLDDAHFLYDPENDFYKVATVRDDRLYYYCICW